MWKESNTEQKASSALISGILLDLSRCLERREYYNQLIPMLAGWGYNTLFFHFVDDEACRYKFRSVPEIASPNSFARKELEKLIAKAGKNGIQVIPELESLGHTRYITDIPKYHHLYESEEKSDQIVYNSLCPSQDESLSIIEKLVLETAEIFPSPYMHVGLDEVSFNPNCPHCKKKFGGKQKQDIYAHWVNQVHTLVRGAGKRMMMWGDHIARNPSMLDSLPKDIIICHWDYMPNLNYYRYPEGMDTYLKTLVQKGFDVLLCPSMMRSGMVLLPSKDACENTQRTAAIASHCFPGTGKILGLMNTVWEPVRHHPDIMQYSMAFAAHVFKNNGDKEKNFDAEFTGRFFGVTNRSKAKSISTLLAKTHQLPALGVPLNCALPHHLGLLSWSPSTKISPEEIKKWHRFKIDMDHLAGHLKDHEKFITAHKSAFRAYIQTVEIISFLCGQMLVIEKLEGPLEAAAKDVKNLPLIRQMAAKTRRMQKKWDRIWMQYRYADDPIRKAEAPKFWKWDHVYFRLTACANHLESILQKQKGRAA